MFACKSCGLMLEASKAKRDLTDAEFMALCIDCARWIGERIEAVEAIAQQKVEAA